MKTCERKIIVINFLQKGPIKRETVQVGPIRFSIIEHAIGWDFKTAEILMSSFDGYADGFAFTGIQKHLGIKGNQVYHPGYLRLLRFATKTPIYVAEDLRDFFSEWTLKRVLQEQPQLFFGKKVLLQCALITPVLNSLRDQDATLWFADPLMIFGVPILLRGYSHITAFNRLIQPLITPALQRSFRPAALKDCTSNLDVLSKWISKCDIFLGYGKTLSRVKNWDIFANKIILVDYVDEITRRKIEKAGSSQIIEFIPECTTLQMPAFKNFPVLEAVIDQTRIFENSKLALSEYLLKWIEKTRAAPRRLKSTKGFRRKCAFIVHPLIQEDLWKLSSTKSFAKAPVRIRNWIEKGASQLPCFHIGNLTGVVSQSTGQEVDCDFYALAATPKMILGMKEEFLYRRLVECVELAKSRGAGIVGLGAYTKVAGDAGVTVARKSSIPVTNGNSYSASTTLWAARQMVERMGIVSPTKVGNRFQAKAMIIGATGSIGRVSSLLVSLVFQEMVLVANRPDKLLELREEILKLSPDVKVSLATQSHSEISDSDLIVTATSSHSGNVLDMSRVKPGAVICDCSRPLDISQEEAGKRRDVLVIESGEIILPGNPKINVDLGLPHPSVYACTAETVLLTLEGRFESFSLSKQLSLERTKEIYKLGMKHGAQLSAIRGPSGLITDEQILRCRELALKNLNSWKTA
jgi:predicted amino acid dehydrogenase